MTTTAAEFEITRGESGMVERHSAEKIVNENNCITSKNGRREKKAENMQCLPSGARWNKTSVPVLTENPTIVMEKRKNHDEDHCWFA